MDCLADSVSIASVRASWKSIASIGSVREPPPKVSETSRTHSPRRKSSSSPGVATGEDQCPGVLPSMVFLTFSSGDYSVMITPSLAIPVRLAYFKTIVGDFQLPPDYTRSIGVALPSAS